MQLFNKIQNHSDFDIFYDTLIDNIYRENSIISI